MTVSWNKAIQMQERFPVPPSLCPRLRGGFCLNTVMVLGS